MLVLAFQPMIFDLNIAALGIARFTKSLAKRVHSARRRVELSNTEIGNDRHRRLLRSRGQRPCNYRAAEKPDEFPPPHGIYSPGREPPSCKSNTNLERR